MKFRTRKRLALLVLVVGLPLYIAAAVSLVNWLDRAWGRLPLMAELALYVLLAFAWALPLKPLFRGVGQAEPQDKGRS